MNKKKDKNIRSMKRLFWTFVGIVVFCAVVVVLNLMLQKRESQNPDSPYYDMNERTWVMELPAAGDVYYEAHEATGTVEGVSAEVHVSQYDVSFKSDDGSKVSNSYLVWGNVFSVIHTVSIVAAIVFGLLCAMSFYRSVTRGEKFNLRFVHFLRWVGIMVLVNAVCVLMGKLMTSIGTGALLPDSIYRPHVQIEMGITHFIFGIVVLFLARVLDISYKLQEEQEYTV